jgi:hypothetical protein
MTMVRREEESAVPVEIPHVPNQIVDQLRLDSTLDGYPSVVDEMSKAACLVIVDQLSAA